MTNKFQSGDTIIIPKGTLFWLFNGDTTFTSLYDEVVTLNDDSIEKDLLIVTPNQILYNQSINITSYSNNDNVKWKVFLSDIIHYDNKLNNLVIRSINKNEEIQLVHITINNHKLIFVEASKESKEPSFFGHNNSLHYWIGDCRTISKAKGSMIKMLIPVKNLKIVSKFSELKDDLVEKYVANLRDSVNTLYKIIDSTHTVDMYVDKSGLKCINRTEYGLPLESFKSLISNTIDSNKEYVVIEDLSV